MTNKVFVSSLPWATTSDNLKQLFSQAGTVLNASVMVDTITGRSQGTGIVEFETQTQAEDAISMFNGQNFQGMTLVVSGEKGEGGKIG